MKQEIIQKELWLVGYHWLRQCGSFPDKDFCRDEMTGHPDYPSLVAITDFLDSGGMRFQAVKADASYIKEFVYPVLAHIKEPGNDFLHSVATPADWARQKDITNNWSGIVIYPDGDSRWQNGDSTAYRRKSARRTFTALGFSLLGAMIFIATCMVQPAFLIDLYGFFSTLGIVVSLYILTTELGFENRIVKQVCGGGGENACSKVLKSKYGRGIFGITPGDWSVIYFTGQFALYTISAFYKSYLPLMLWLSMAGPVIAGWSVYTQAFKVKQWCAFCLGLAAVLVLQAVIGFLTITSFITMIPTLVSGAIFFLVLLTVLSIKQLLNKNNAYRAQVTELRKWKLDGDLFLNQWQQEPPVNTTIWDTDLLLGSPNAPVTITIACSPYCKPCARAHAELDEMLHRFDGKLKVLIRLVCFPDKEDSMITMAVAAILRKARECGQLELHRALADWFVLMDLEKWRTKWPVDSRIDVRDRLFRHSEWINKNQIAYTPTLFLNGRKVPGRYRLEDIALLIPQLSGMEELSSAVAG